MSAFNEPAYAKLNLALHVRGRMADGRHRLETVFAFCQDGDELAGDLADHITLEIDGPFASGLATDRENLVVRAADALRDRAEVAEGAALRLTKNLPLASGIGGGSADAAAALRLLTALWGIDAAHAAAAASRLGSDVPACLLSMTARGIGAGDELCLVDSGISGTPVLLVNPGKPLSTAEVFARWDGIDRGPLDDWRTGRNDLEAPATALVPEIAAVLDWLSGQPGAAFPRMSGSGGTCFALFDSLKERDAAAEAVPDNWWHLATKLR